MIKFDSEAKKYGFYIGIIILSLIFSFVFLGQSIDPMEGVQNLLTHHNLIDTDAFYIGGYSGALLNAALTLGVALIFFAITKTEIGSLEMGGLGLVFGYSFYGKNFLAIIPLMLGVYLYQAYKGNELSGKSAIACFAGSLSPLVSTVAFHTNNLVSGSPVAIIVALALGLVTGFAIAWVSDWVPDILQGRSILLGAACAGLVIIVIGGILRSFGFFHEASVDPPYMDQSMYWPILLAWFAFMAYYIIAGLLGGASFRSAIDQQTCTADNVCVDLVLTYNFADGLLNTGLIGIFTGLYFAILPYTEMHGEIWAGMMTTAAFAPKGLTLRYALPFWIGLLGFNFVSSGVAGALAGESFVQSGLMKIASRATLMGTFVGANIAPLNRNIGLKRGIAMGIIYALIVVKVSALHDQMLLYNSGFAIALTVILYNVAGSYGQEAKEAL